MIGGELPDCSVSRRGQGPLRLGRRPINRADSYVLDLEAAFRESELHDVVLGVVIFGPQLDRDRSSLRLSRTA